MTKKEELLHNLLLHNEEDLLGMKYLLPLFSYRMLCRKKYRRAAKASTCYIKKTDFLLST
ncbi:hypothetical protein [Anaerobutyricum soehngenii]|nr:hypothetical protein [Anaerobutyricum soehngenii]